MRERKYATVFWTVEDILERADENEVRMTRDEAARLLGFIEERIVEKMTISGWLAVEDALAERAAT